MDEIRESSGPMVGGGNALDATNPYQPGDLDTRQRRRPLIVIVSAGLGSILALVLLNIVVHPSRSAPAVDIELSPAAPPVDTNTTTSVLTEPVSTVPASPAPVPYVATLPPPSTTTPTPRWVPPGTPDFVQAALLDGEGLDVVAPSADGTMAYFTVSKLGDECGVAVYRLEQGHDRVLVSSARYLMPRGDGRWIILASSSGSECRPGMLTIVDMINDTAREMPAAGWFYGWSTTGVRFTNYDYLSGRFTLFDAPSATSLPLAVSSPFAAELDARVGPRPEGDPGWLMGRVAFLADGELVAHIQCRPDACPQKDSISGWFYVVDGQVAGESARVPVDKAPPVTFYCGV